MSELHKALDEVASSDAEVVMSMPPILLLALCSIAGQYCHDNPSGSLHQEASLIHAESRKLIEKEFPSFFHELQQSIKAASQNNVEKEGVNYRII